MSDNIHSFNSRQGHPANGNGGGGDDIYDRITRLEEKMNYVATREDILRLESLLCEKHVDIKDKIHDQQIASNKDKMTSLRWVVGLSVLSTGSVVTLLGIILTIVFRD